MKDEPESDIEYESTADYGPVEITPLDKTIEQSENTKTFNCKECTYKTKLKDHLKVHTLKHTEDKNKKHKCSQCPYMSARPWDLKKHLKIHSEGKPHKCDQCMYASKNISDLYKHVRKRHNNEG